LIATDVLISDIPLGANPTGDYNRSPRLNG
jgi:hypothetical protein